MSDDARIEIYDFNAQLVASFAERFNPLKYQEKTHLSSVSTPPGHIRKTARDHVYVVIRTDREGHALF